MRFPNRCCPVLLIFIIFAIGLMAGCRPSDSLSDIKVTSPPSESYLESERVRALLATPAVSLRWCESEPAEGLIHAKWRDSRDVYIHSDCIIDENQIHDVFAHPSDKKEPSLSFSFTSEGAERMERATETERDRQIALVVEGRIEIVCGITGKLSGDMIATGFGTPEEMSSLANKISEHLKSTSDLKQSIAKNRFQNQIIAVVAAGLVGIALIYFVLWKR